MQLEVQIYIDTELLDLYDDESISIKSAIADLSDITKLKTDFSRTFTVPASNKNNRLFKHYYNADIDNTFDARKKVNGRIELGGMPFKFGKWKLQKVSVKNGLPSSYTINFTGNLVDLEKTFGKSKLSDIDLSEYNHEFNSDNVVLKGLNSQGLKLFDGDVKYTMLAPKRYYYNSDSNDTTNTDNLVNIANNGVGDVRGVNYLDLKPSITLEALHNKVQEHFGITFSNNFFNTINFTKLHLYCSNSTDRATSQRNLVNLDTGSTKYCNYTTNLFTISPTTDYIRTNIVISPKLGYENIKYKYYVVRDDKDVKSVGFVNGNNSSQYFLGQVSTETIVKFEIESEGAFEYNVTVDVTEISVPNIYTDFTSTGEGVVSYVFDVNANIPDLEVFDFYKSIFKAFKLIAIPREDGSIYVETLNNYYRLGKFIDVTKYIDLESYDVETGGLFNEINFNFEEPNTILNKEFKKQNALSYGNEKVILTDENGELLDGSSLDIDVKFEQVVYERLTDENTGELTTFQYGTLINEDLNAENPKVLLHYVNEVLLSGNPVNVVQDQNIIGELFSVYTPSHSISFSDTSPQPFSFLFSSEYSTYTYSLLDKNLYTEYHQNYIEGIFNIKRRNFFYKANLPQSIITKINLNDVLIIDKNYYRIDYFETDITTGSTSLKLFNAYDSELIGVANKDYTVTDSGAKVFYPEEAQSITLVDLGNGTSWLTAIQVGTEIVFTLEDNNTGLQRFARVDVVSVSGKLTQISVIQDSKTVITVDNETITVDNDIITVDG